MSEQEQRGYSQEATPAFTNLLRARAIEGEMTGSAVDSRSSRDCVEAA